MDTVTQQDAEEAVRTLLRYAGDDPAREGLLDTPARVARMYREVFSGLREDCPKATAFSTKYSDMQVIGDLSFISMCEHHLVPFVGAVHIGYLPNGKVLGLSKFGRVVDWVASRPQIQEEMTGQIADKLMELMTPAPEGLIVVVAAEHMCMSLRGVKKPGHVTVTASIRPGELAIDKDEFMRLIDMARRGRR